MKGGERERERGDWIEFFFVTVCVSFIIFSKQNDDENEACLENEGF